MRGYVYQRRKPDGTWTIVYDEGRRADGKRQQRTIGGFETKREAQDALTKRLHELRSGTYVEPSRMSLAEYLLDEWLPSIIGNVRPATYATYSSLVRTHIVTSELGRQRLQGLKPAQVKRFYSERERRPGDPGGDGLSAETLRLLHSVLRKALADAVSEDRLVRNPLERVPRPKPDESPDTTRKARGWTERELRDFLAQAESDRLYALWLLAATTGMRRGELLGLNWRSLELEAGRLGVNRQLLATGEFGPPKSKRSNRMIALDPTTVQTLTEHKEAQNVERALAGDAYADGDLVFASELGAPIPPNRLSERFMRLRKAAGVKQGTMHTLRHTAATLMLSGIRPSQPGADDGVPAVPLHVVAARLGDRPETVLRVYAHLLPKSDEDAAAGMARIIAGPTEAVVR